MKKPFRRECFRCHIQESDYVKMEEHHLLEGRGRRKISDRYGLMVTLCGECHWKAHHDKDEMDFLHRTGQEKAEADGMSRAQFIQLFGRNYLD